MQNFSVQSQYFTLNHDKTTYSFYIFHSLFLIIIIILFLWSDFYFFSSSCHCHWRQHWLKSVRFIPSKRSDYTIRQPKRQRERFGKRKNLLYDNKIILLNLVKKFQFCKQAESQSHCFPFRFSVALTIPFSLLWRIKILLISSHCYVKKIHLINRKRSYIAAYMAASGSPFLIFCCCVFFFRLLVLFVDAKYIIMIFMGLFSITYYYFYDA